MGARKVIAVKDWSCGMSDELGRVVLTINPTEGEPILVLMTIFQAARMAGELGAPNPIHTPVTQRPLGKANQARWGSPNALPSEPCCSVTMNNGAITALRIRAPLSCIPLLKPFRGPCVDHRADTGDIS